MSSTVRIQTRGRVTLPAELREALEVAPGDEVEFVESAPGRFEVKRQAKAGALLKKDERRRNRVELPTRTATPQLELPLKDGVS